MHQPPPTHRARYRCCHLAPLDPLDICTGGPGPARPDGAAGRRGTVQHRDRGAGRLFLLGSDALAWPLCSPRPGRVPRPAPLRPAAHHRRHSPGRDRCRHPRRPAARQRPDALVDPLPVKSTSTSRMTVARVWADHDLAPHRIETFKFSTDPELLAKVTDLCGLYLEPPAGAVVLCVDEKSQIQALDRTAPTLPLRPGGRAAHPRLRAPRHHQPVRRPRRRHREDHRSLLRPPPPQRVPGLPQTGCPALPRRQLHVVLDNDRAPTSTPRFGTGSPAPLEDPGCTSRQRRPVG